MMNDGVKVIDLNEFKKEQKKLERKAKINNLVKKGKAIYENNKELVLISIPILAGAVGKTIKFVSKRINLRKEEDIKDLYCYDRSLGHYWRLRRELTNKEWLAIDERKKNGERLADILADLRVLK